MKNKLTAIVRHPLISGSIVVVLGSMFANFFGLLYQVFMSRNLSLADYGTLSSIVALIGIPGIAAGAVQPMIINFAAGFFANNELSKLRGLYIKINRFFIIISTAFFFLFLIFIPQINLFFHINNDIYLILADIIIYITLLSVINGGFLQAKMAFGYMVLVAFIGASLKLLLSITFVTFNYAILGAITALLLATIVSYFLTFLPLKFVFDRNIQKPKINTKSLFAYGIPSALTFLGLNSLISSDIILVKHFFDPPSAGAYAVVSLVGRIIFFASSPVVSVMFPLIVQKYSKKEKYADTFKLAFFLVLSSSFAITVFYLLFPQFMLLMLAKKATILSVTYLVMPFSIFMILYSLVSITGNFYLSINKTKVYIPVSISAILQIILICFFHHNFLQIVYISITITFLLLLSLLLYYPHATRVKKN